LEQYYSVKDPKSGSSKTVDVTTFLYQQSLPGLVATIVTSWLLVLLINENNSTSKYIWLAVMQIVITLRMVDLLQWRNLGKVYPYDWRFSLGLFITLFLWVVYIPLFFPAASDVELAVTLCVFVGISGGSTITLSARPVLSMTYVTSMLVPASLYVIFFRSDSPIQMSGFIGLSYWLVMIPAVRRITKATYDTSALYLENKALLEQMVVEKRSLDLANSELLELKQSLEKKVAARTERLQQIAATDQLTGLWNRSQLADHLEQRIHQYRDGQESEKFSLLFIDLDGFKEVNDIQGHLVGDQVLKTVAERVQHLDGVDYLCRWGGDEFVAVINVFDKEALGDIATRIIARIARPIPVRDEVFEVGATIGIATYPDDGGSVEELLQASDLAMYVQKKSLKGRFIFFDKSIQDRLHRDHALKEALKRACDDDSLYLLYQPIVPVDETQPSVYEALLRWLFKGDVVSPVEFIPLAESTGAIQCIGNWVLRKACQDLASGQLGPDSIISVNVSMHQLASEQIVEVVREVLAETGLAAGRLHIEITETVLCESSEQAIQTLLALRELGIAISLDDFGTGYSSLSYLQEFPIDTIKIDRSFVNNIDASGGKIIEATIAVAKAFDYRIVAEGVETEQQQSALIGMGVDYIQGYYISKPKSIECFYTEN